MITINLLPEEFRVQPKSTSNVPIKKIAIGVGAFFIILTVFFYIELLFVRAHSGQLDKQWVELQPRSAELKKLEQEVDVTLKPEKDFMERFVTSAKPLTYFWLWMSEFLPDTSWLTEVSMERKGDGGGLMVKGLTLNSKEKSSIEHIEIYLHKLKEKMPDANLNLTTTRVKISETEVTQFIANFDWGTKTK
jgi:hypothetical protein